MSPRHLTPPYHGCKKPAVAAYVMRSALSSTGAYTDLHLAYTKISPINDLFTGNWNTSIHKPDLDSALNPSCMPLYPIPCTMYVPYLPQLLEHTEKPQGRLKTTFGMPCAVRDITSNQLKSKQGSEDTQPWFSLLLATHVKNTSTVGCDNSWLSLVNQLSCGHLAADEEIITDIAIVPVI